MTLQASDLSYKAEYNEDILGKGVSDPAIAYPEHDRLKKIKDITKKVALTMRFIIPESIWSFFFLKVC